jgi:hypothetical protein
LACPAPVGLWFFKLNFIAGESGMMIVDLCSRGFR